MSVLNRHTGFEQFDKGDEVAVHFYSVPRTDTEDERRVTGEIETFYSEERALIDVDPSPEEQPFGERTFWVIDFGAEFSDSGVHTFDEGDEMGSPVFVEAVDSQQNDSDSDSDMNDNTEEEITDVSELNVGDEVITSKGDSMDVKALEVTDIQEIDGDLTATIEGDWANSRKYSLVESKFGITMPDVGIITVKRVSEAEPEKEICTDGGEDQNDITRAYQFCGTLNELAGRWESKLQDQGSIASNVHSSASPNGKFERGWHAGGAVEISATFTIPMDIPAFHIEQMKQEFREFGASVEIDVSASVTGRPPKVKESGAVIPRGPSQERIDAMDESEKLHTGKVTVSMDITDQMQGVPSGLIIEGSRVAFTKDITEEGIDEAPKGEISSIHGDHVYVQFDGDQTVTSVAEDELALIQQNLGDA